MGAFDRLAKRKETTPRVGAPSASQIASYAMVRAGWLELQEWAFRTGCGALDSCVPELKTQLAFWTKFDNDWIGGKQRVDELAAVTLDLTVSQNSASEYGFPSIYDPSHKQPGGYGTTHQVSAPDPAAEAQKDVNYVVSEVITPGAPEIADVIIKTAEDIKAEIPGMGLPGVPKIPTSAVIIGGLALVGVLILAVRR